MRDLDMGLVSTWWVRLSTMHIAYDYHRGHWLAFEAFCRGMQRTLNPEPLILSMPEPSFQQKLCSHAMGPDRLAW